LRWISNSRVYFESIRRIGQLHRPVPSYLPPNTEWWQERITKVVAETEDGINILAARLSLTADRTCMSAKTAVSNSFATTTAIGTLRIAPPPPSIKLNVSLK
jgi:hypothetical protein